MALAFVDVASAGASANSTTATCPKPAALASGHYMLAVITWAGASTNITTVPTGWTLRETPIITAPCNHWVYEKVAGGSESANYAWVRDTAGTWTVVIACYSDQDVTTPVEATAATDEAGAADATILHPALTTSTPDDQLVGLWSHGGGTVAGIAYTAPDVSYTIRAVARPTTSAQRNSGIVDKTLAAINPPAFDITTDRPGAHAARTVALKPAVSIPVTYTQTTFRGRNDDGSETSATWKAAAGADWTQPVGENLRIRFRIASAASVPAQGGDYRLRYSLNGGAYTSVTPSALVARPSASPHVADGISLTEQLGPSGTYNAGDFDSSVGNAAGFGAATATGDETELEYCIQLRAEDLTNGDLVRFRVYSIATGALDSYTDTPIVTVTEALPTVELAGSMAVEAATTGTLEVSKLPAGSVATEEAVAGSLEVAKPLAGSIATEEAISGTPSASKLLTGSVAGEAALGGAPTASKLLSSQMATDEAFSGDLNVGAAAPKSFLWSPYRTLHKLTSR